jgi:hypothetical protein
MLTIPFLLSIFLNAVIGTIPFLGPVIAGFLIGILIGKKNPAMVVGFLGAIIGGVFCRVFLSYPDNGWYHHLLNLFGHKSGQCAGMIIQGSPFFFALYFGLLGILGGLTGSFFLNKMKDLRKK